MYAIAVVFTKPQRIRSDSLRPFFFFFAHDPQKTNVGQFMWGFFLFFFSGVILGYDMIII